MQITYTLCDMCWDQHGQDSNKAAGTITVVVNNKATQLDLCDEHAIALESTLMPYFKAGRRPDPADVPKVKKSQKALPVGTSQKGVRTYDNEIEPSACPICGKVSTSLTGFYVHLYKAHGVEKPSSVYPIENYRVNNPENNPVESPRDRRNRLQREGRQSRKKEMANAGE